MSDFVWWRDGVIYQIYPRSFMDSNGDGIGDLPGITTRLGHLAALGVDALWLSPIYPSPFYDFGYDVADYEAIDPLFGALADFDALVAEAHRLGLRVVLDLVMNHTSHLHPWFVESRASRESPKRDWYLWRDPAADGGPPNNWQSVFGGSAWTLDPATGQYYYHQFLKEQPDLNWRNPAVYQRMFAMMRFWLDRGVDGFRLDVVQSFYKDAAFRDNPTTWRPDRPLLGLRAYDRQDHVYDRDQPEMLDLLRDLRRLLNAYPGRMAVGETSEMVTGLRYIGDERLHMAFNFEFNAQDMAQLPWRPRFFQSVIERYEAEVPADGWPCYVLSNHDSARHATRLGGGPYADQRAKVAAALLLTQRGTPFLYYGEELGMQNTPIPRAELQDPVGRRYWPLNPGRDPARTPMQWDASPHAGFTTGQPWLRVNADHARRNVAEQTEDPHSVLNFYKRLLGLRRASPALRRGAITFLQRRPVYGLAYLRHTPGQTMLVALNFFGHEVTLPLDQRLPTPHWQLRLTSGVGDQPRVRHNTVTLGPFEACVLEAESEY